MSRKLKLGLNGLGGNERGMALLLVLVLLLLGSLLIVPLLGFVSTGLKTGQVFETRGGEQFAADAGIQDALWHIKYSYLGSLPFSPVYNQFDFGTVWSYDLAQQVNDQDVSITIQNIWVPSNIPAPSQPTASAIIVGEKLVVTGSATTTTGKITMTYSPGAGEDLRVETLGVWLPRGFSYVTGGSSLEADQQASYYSVPTVQYHQGNQALLWTFNSVPFTDFPGADSHEFPITTEITFEFTSIEPGDSPNIVAWTTTSGVGDIPFSWDADTRVYKATSQAGNTTVDYYTFQNEIRHLRSAVAGDYVATGNSLMIDTTYDSNGIRDQLLASSDAAVSSIPLDADVGAAFLYWSGWLSNSRMVTVLSDTCTNFNNWTNGAAWSIYSNRFRGQYSSGGDPARLLTLTLARDLHTYAAGTVKVSWDQWVSTLADVFSDSSNNFNNWNNGAAWSVYSSDYFQGHYSSGANTTRLLTLQNSQDLSAYAGGTVKVSWDQWVSTPSSLFSDTCSNFDNWNNGSAWAVYSGRFRGRYSSGDNTTRLITLKNNQDLSAYASGTVRVSWDQWVSSGTGSPTDGLDFAFSADGGTTWSNNITAFRGDIESATNFSYTIPSQYLTSTFKMRFALAGFGGSGPYGNIDNVKITPAYTMTDGLDFAFSADGGTTWSSNMPAFRGDIGGSATNFSYTIPSQYLTSTFKMRFYLVGMTDSGKYANIEYIKITPVYDSADGLDFGFSADGGVTWSNDMLAFRGDIGGSAVNFSYTVPYQYLSNNFKMRFRLVGFGGTGEYCNLDNIKILEMPADTSITFRINGTQVYFDGDGQPAQGAQPITSDRSQVFANASGFSFSCYKDVTNLVRTYSTKAPDPAVNHPGNGTYTVGDVLGDTGTDLSYAGWSLIVVYTSAATQGHQLYLYDKFMYSPGDTEVDFDNDGLPGGYISGFIVPDPIPGEVNAASLTVFIGEGDDCWIGDFIAFNPPISYLSNPDNVPDSYKLWDGTLSTEAPGTNTSSNPDNVWNSKSLGLTADGVDIDTFGITWASGVLQPRDTSAWIDISTNTDNWNLIYIIISFRSSVTTGSALSYLIR